MTEETTEIIEVAPSQQGMQMPVVDPLLLPFMLPFMFIQQLSLALMQMQIAPLMQTMSSSPQQTIVKLGYDKDGNVTSVYERKW